MIDDEPYDDDELRDARALAEALDRRGAPDREIGDALDAAELVALLRAPVLEEARAEAVLAETERRIAEAKRRSRMRVTWLGSAAGALALAAAALLVVLRHAPRGMETSVSAPAPVATAPTAAPSTAAPSAASAPTDALRAAQVAWLDAPSPDTSAALERELAVYRNDQLAVLARRYAP